MSSAPQLRRGHDGSPKVSATFLLRRKPEQEDRLSDLVEFATIALDLEVVRPDLVGVRFELALSQPVVCDVPGPFGNGALTANLIGLPARALLLCLFGGDSGPDVRTTIRTSDGRVETHSTPLGALLGPALSRDPGRIVHFVTADGGRLDGLLPARPIPRTRGPKPVPIMLTGRIAQSITLAARPEVVHIRPDLVRPEVIGGVVLPAEETGPILSSTPLWDDRSKPSKWFLPTFTVVEPPLGIDPGASPFGFDVVRSGHAADGSEGLEATIRITLASDPPKSVTDAAAAAGNPDIAPITLSDLRVGLSVPFRDQDGADQTENVPARSVSINGIPGMAGCTVVAEFVVRDNWARLAYGALSVAGFQAKPATVSISASYAAWRKGGRWQHFVTDKLIALRRSGPKAKPIAASQLHQLAASNISAIAPASRLRPEVVADLLGRQLELAQHNLNSAPTVLFPCGDHGQLYRMAGNPDWSAIGCQPALRLGSVEYRTWEPVAVAAAAGLATVFKSLIQPGLFLVVPASYCLGRYVAGHPDRAYRPTLLLHSTIDVDNPTNIRCVMAATLEPDLSRAQLGRIGAELATTRGITPQLLLPWQLGLIPQITWAAPSAAELDCVPSDSGFSVLLSTDIAGFLTIRALLEQSGLAGSASWTLPGGVHASASLKLGLDRVIGPGASGGPVSVKVAAAVATLTNHLDRRVSVPALTANGVDLVACNLLLEPEGTAHVPLPAAATAVDVDYQVAPGAESLDETRAYIEDLALGVIFIATSDLSTITGIEIACDFLGKTGPPVVLTQSLRQVEKQFVLPLTAYAADPVLTFTTTVVATDGTRTTAPPVAWPVRSRGVLVPITLPIQT